MATTIHDDTGVGFGIGFKAERVTLADLSQEGEQPNSSWINPGLGAYGQFKQDQYGYGVGYLTALESMTQEEKETLHSQLTDQLEHLRGLHGTSRAFATGYQACLPPSIALESFTTHVSKENYEISLESISATLKVVALSLLIGAVAGLAQWALRSAVRGIALKVKGPQDIQNSIRVFDNCSDFIKACLAKVNAPAVNKALYADFASQDAKLAALLRPQMTESNVADRYDDTALAYRALVTEPNVLVSLILTTHYQPVAPMIVGDLNKLIEGLEAGVNKLIAPMVDLALRGTDMETMGSFLQKNAVAPVPVKFDGLNSWARKAKLSFDGNHLDMQNQLVHPLTEQASPEALVKTDWANTQASLKACGGAKDAYRAVVSANERLERVGQQLERLSKRLESAHEELPREAVAIAKASVSGLRDYVTSLEQISRLVETEVNAMMAVVAMAVTTVRQSAHALARAAATVNAEVQTKTSTIILAEAKSRKLKDLPR